MKRRILGLLIPAAVLLTGWNNAVSAQSLNDSVRIFFHQGRADIDPDLYANRKALSRLQQMLNDSTRMQANVSSLLIDGWTSPEGGETLNRHLAEKRAAAIWRRVMMLTEKLPVQHTAKWNTCVNFSGTDWKRLHELMSNNPEATYAHGAQKLLAELADSAPEQPDDWLKRLKQLDGGRTYAYAYRQLFPALRTATVRLVCLPRGAARRADTVVVERHDTIYIHDTLRVNDTVYVEKTRRMKREPVFVAVKTNLLYDAVLIPNLGVEVMLKERWSVAANWMYTWMKCDHRHRYWRIYGGELEWNRRFGRRPKGENRMSGHRLGVYGQLLTYDVEWGGRGYLGDKWSWGGGLTYGYALPVARRLNLDFTVNMGYLGGIYKEYLPIDGHYVWQRTRRMRWVGPTKIGIHLVWLMGRENKNGWHK